MFFVLMRRQPPRSTLMSTLFPYPTLFRSRDPRAGRLRRDRLAARQGAAGAGGDPRGTDGGERRGPSERAQQLIAAGRDRQPRAIRDRHRRRSEEHTSELQSLMRISYAVFCLEKKNLTNKITTYYGEC